LAINCRSFLKILILIDDVGGSLKKFRPQAMREKTYPKPSD